jgi:integrase
MACIRQRRGRWVVDYRDASGRRRVPSFSTRAQAEAAFAVALRLRTRLLAPGLDPGITLEQYARRWIRRKREEVRGSSIRRYDSALRLAILNNLGERPVSELTRRELAEHLRAQNHVRPSTAPMAWQLLRQLLAAAVEDGLLEENPAEGRSPLAPTRGRRHANPVKVLTRAELGQVLEAARREAAWFAPILTLADTGVRPGELLGLRWGDVDEELSRLSIHRQLYYGHAEAGTPAEPKTERGRRVLAISPRLLEAWRDRRAQAREEDLRLGREGSPWVWFPEVGRDVGRVPANLVSPFVGGLRVALRRVFAAAEISSVPVIPYTFRHTWISLLLSGGASIAAVSKAAGHSSIQITVDLYGRWATYDLARDIQALEDATTAATRPRGPRNGEPGRVIGRIGGGGEESPPPGVPTG